MKNEVRSSKEEKYHRVYEECLRLIHENGLKAINHSAIARRAQVSRPWIYKYMGESREELIQSAVKYFGTEFTKFSLRKVDIKGPKDMLRALWNGTISNLEFANEYPFIISLYIRFAGTENVLGRTIDELESLYLRRLHSKFLQVLKDDELAYEAAKVVKATRIGAALEYGPLNKKKMTEEEKKKIFNTLASMLKKLLKEYIRLSQKKRGV